MNEAQIRLISWMYNMCSIHFKMTDASQADNDIRLLQEAVVRRFPDYADQITAKLKDVEGL